MDGRERLSQTGCQRPIYHLPCRHCKRRRGSTLRGLCHTCYDDHSVRRLYPAMSKAERAKKNRAIGNPHLEPASDPCEAMPGTEQRMAVYAARIERREETFCLKDVRPNLE